MYNHSTREGSAFRRSLHRANRAIVSRKRLKSARGADNRVWNPRKYEPGPLSETAFALVYAILDRATARLKRSPGQPAAFTISFADFKALTDDWIAAAPVATRALQEYLRVHRLPYELTLDEDPPHPQLKFEPLKV